jgi:hypothetical protein
MDEHRDGQPWLQVLVLFGAVAVLLVALLPHGGVRLTEVYRSEDGTITFRYPDGWIVEEPPLTVDQIMLRGVRISDGTELMYALDIKPGQISGAIAWGTGHDFLTLAGEASSSFPEVNLYELVETLTAQAPAEGHTYTVQEIMLGQNRAMRIDDNYNNQLQHLDFIIELDNNYFGLIGFFTLPDDMKQFEPTVLAIAASLHYQPP